MIRVQAPIHPESLSLQNQTSEPKIQTSDLKPQTFESGIQNPTTDLRTQTSDLRPQTFESGIQNPTPDLSQLPIGNQLYVPPAVSSNEQGNQSKSYHVARIDDFRPARGKKPAQYFLIFSDQPASESIWVSVDECKLYPGFDEALHTHQNRRTLRSAVVPT